MSSETAVNIKKKVVLKCLPKDIRFFGVSSDQQLCTSSLDKVRERERKRKEISFVDKNVSNREGK